MNQYRCTELSLERVHLQLFRPTTKEVRVILLLVVAGFPDAQLITGSSIQVALASLRPVNDFRNITGVELFEIMLAAVISCT